MRCLVLAALLAAAAAATDAPAPPEARDIQLADPEPAAAAIGALDLHTFSLGDGDQGRRRLGVLPDAARVALPESVVRRGYLAVDGAVPEHDTVDASAVFYTNVLATKQLLRDVAALRQDLGAATAVSPGDLEEARSATDLKLQTASSQLAALEARLAALMQTADGARATADGASSAVTGLKAEAAAAEDERRRLAARAEEAEAAAKAAAAAADALEGALAKQADTLGGHADSLGDLEARLREGDLSGRLAAAEEAVAALRDAASAAAADDTQRAARGAAAAGQFARFAADGALEGAGAALQLADDGALRVAKLAGTALAGDLDAAGHAISGAVLQAAAVRDASELSVAGAADVAGQLVVGGDAQVRGSMLVSGSVVGSGPYTDSSDRRFKRDVAALDPADALAALARLRPVEYELRADEFPERGFAEGRQLGFIAQELAEAMPGQGLVAEGADGYLSVAYARLVPVLVAALQEQQGQIEMLRETCGG